MSRGSTARGSNTGLFIVGPAKVKASKCFLFTEGFLEVENKKNMGLCLYILLFPP